MSDKNFDKASEIGQISAIGSVQLFFGMALSTVILGVGTIILGAFILPSEYGLYGIATIPLTTALLFQDWGIGSAMVRFCAQGRASSGNGDLYQIIKAGMAFEAATGLILTFISIAISGYLAYAVFNEPALTTLIPLISITIFSSAIMTGTASIFVGFDKMKLSAFASICQAVIQGILSPFLVYIGYGAFGVVLGFTIGSLSACSISIILLYFRIFRQLKPESESKSPLYQTLKPMLKYGIPLALAGLVGGLLPQVYSFLMARYCSIDIIGNYRVATNFAVLISFFTFPITTVLFPAFSKVDPHKERHLLRNVFESSVKYTSIVLVPATIGLIVLSSSLINTLYGAKWVTAPTLLALIVTVNLFALLGYISLASLFAALGETKLMLKLNLLSLAVGIPLAFILIPLYGIIGVVVGSIISLIPGMLFGLHIANKQYDAQASSSSSIRILFASIIPAAITFIFVNFTRTISLVHFSIGGLLFLTLYLLFAPLLGAITQAEIDNLRSIFSNMGIIFKIINVLFIFMEKVLKIRDVWELKMQGSKSNNNIIAK